MSRSKNERKAHYAAKRAETVERYNQRVAAVKTKRIARDLARAERQDDDETALLWAVLKDRHRVVFAASRYLGGSPMLGRPVTGTLVFGDRIAIGLVSKRTIEWDEVEGIVVTGGQASPTQTGIAARLWGQKQQTTLDVFTKDGGQQIFRVDKQSAADVRGKLLHVLRVRSVPLR